MPLMRLLKDVPGMGKANTTRAVTSKAAAKLVEQGLAEQLDFTGQAIPAPPTPVPAAPLQPAPAPPAIPTPAAEEVLAVEPEGKTTDDADNPNLQDPAPDTGTQPRKSRKKSF